MPHITRPTGVPPCELLMKRRLKTRFDLLRPDIDSHIVRKQEDQARNYKGNKGKGVIQSFEEGDHVYFKNYARTGPPNISGTVEECTGPVSCKILSSDGNIVNRHFDQMFRQVKPSSSLESTSKFNVLGEGLEQLHPMDNSDANDKRSDQNNEATMLRSENTQVTNKTSPIKLPELRRSSRIHKPVQHLNC